MRSNIDFTNTDNYNRIYRTLERNVNDDMSSLFIECDPCVDIERTIELVKINSKIPKTKCKTISAFKNLNRRGKNL